MRKLAWFIIILAILTPTIIACGLAIPTFGENLHYLFVKVLGEGTANLLLGAITGLFLWGTVNGLQAAAVFVGLLITGGVIWVCIKKFLWDRRPRLMKTAEQKIYQHTPIAALPQVTAEPVPQAITKPELEAKKEEATAS
jgi:predicted lipid-binding transport protein (Tim44 family)